MLFFSTVFLPENGAVFLPENGAMWTLDLRVPSIVAAYISLVFLLWVINSEIGTGMQTGKGYKS